MHAKQSRQRKNLLMTGLEGQLDELKAENKLLKDIVSRRLPPHLAESLLGSFTSSSGGDPTNPTPSAGGSGMSESDSDSHVKKHGGTGRGGAYSSSGSLASLVAVSRPSSGAPGTTTTDRDVGEREVETSEHTPQTSCIQSPQLEDASDQTGNVGARTADGGYGNEVLHLVRLLIMSQKGGEIKSEGPSRSLGSGDPDPDPGIGEHQSKKNCPAPTQSLDSVCDINMDTAGSTAAASIKDLVDADVSKESPPEASPPGDAPIPQSDRASKDVRYEALVGALRLELSRVAPPHTASSVDKTLS